MVEAAQAAAFKNVGALTGRPPTSPEIFLEALFYRLRNSGPWRDLPAAIGPWNTIYGWFRLWAANGLWARLLKIVAKSGGVVCLVDAPIFPFIRVAATHAEVRNIRPWAALVAGGTPS
jgi:transposase